MHCSVRATHACNTTKNGPSEWERAVQPASQSMWAVRCRTCKFNVAIKHGMAWPARPHGAWLPSSRLARMWSHSITPDRRALAGGQQAGRRVVVLARSTASSARPAARAGGLTVPCQVLAADSAPARSLNAGTVSAVSIAAVSRRPSPFAKLAGPPHDRLCWSHCV